jgi:hypothetical protein
MRKKLPSWAERGELEPLSVKLQREMAKKQGKIDIFLPNCPKNRLIFQLPAAPERIFRELSCPWRWTHNSVLFCRGTYNGSRF